LASLNAFLASLAFSRASFAAFSASCDELWKNRLRKIVCMIKMYKILRTVLLALAALSASLNSTFLVAARASLASCDSAGESNDTAGADDFAGTLNDGAAGASNLGMSNDGVLGMSIFGMSNDGVFGISILGMSTLGIEKDGNLTSGISGALNSTAGADTLGDSILGASILGISTFGISGILISFTSGTLKDGVEPSSLAAFWRSTA
jgi:hypothetical protein